MICQNCNQETEPGKFCTKCGAPLEAVDEEVTGTAEEPIIHQSESTEPPVEPMEQREAQPGVEPEAQQPVHQTQQQGQQKGQQVDFAERTKELSSNFGGFFVNALKKPSSAKNANGTQFISGIIMIVVFALLLSIDHYVVLKENFSAEFFDDLAMPFFKYLLLYAIIVALIFGAVHLAQQNLTIQDVLAKYGAYLVPFVLLFIVSIILDLIDMTGLPFSAVGYLAMIGPILIIPVLILSEKVVKGFDYIFTVIVLLLLTYIAYAYLSNSIADINFDDFDFGDLDLPW